MGTRFLRAWLLQECLHILIVGCGNCHNRDTTCHEAAEATGIGAHPNHHMSVSLLSTIHLCLPPDCHNLGGTGSAYPRTPAHWSKSNQGIVICLQKRDVSNISLYVAMVI